MALLLYTREAVCTEIKLLSEKRVGSRELGLPAEPAQLIVKLTDSDGTELHARGPEDEMKNFRIGGKYQLSVYETEDESTVDRQLRD